ncbi:MAG: hypothetical protein O3A00_20150, partial [Planctomycetota bacterium]|nr:hypothetical protein [Planctomycetota bacterium]
LDQFSILSHWAVNGYQQHFASAVDIRVCFVIQSRHRMKTTIESLRKHRVAPFLRFVLVDDFTADKILAEPIWYDANGNPKRILPS